MLSIQTKTKVKLGSKEYEVSYPNVGQILEIENLKLLLSGNSYTELAKSQHKTALNLLNLIDGVAYFTTLIPTFKEEYNVDEFTKMELKQQSEISKAFLYFWKWMQDIENELNNLNDDETPTGNDLEDNDIQ